MLKIHVLAAVVLFSSVVDAAAVQNGEPASRTEQTEMGRKLADLRARLAEDPRVKEAQAAVERAEQAIAEKISRDPVVAEATRAEQTARAEVTKAEQAAATAHPRVQENRRALATAQARAAELELQRRMEEIKAEHLRREAAQKPEHGDLRSRAHLHAQGKEALNADPRLASARKALNDANAVMQAKMKEMPEYKALEQARKAFDAALAASPLAKDAEAARRTLDEKVAADERVAAQAAKVKAAAAAQDAHRKTTANLEKTLRETAVEVAAKDPRVMEAGKAVAAARERVRKTVEERTAADRNALEATRSAWREKVGTVIAENPEAKALMAEIRGLEDRLRRLRDQMGELRRPVSQAKP